MKNNTSLILEFLNEILPNAHCQLNYTKDYELVIAVMLSAQTTDKAVNKVTNKLFSEFNTLEKLANADPLLIENHIRTLGLYKNKTKNIIDIAKALISDFDSIVPYEKSKLITLPGVGVKTANVVRAELFKIPEIAVDTHISRISKRLGLVSNNDNVELIEKKLRKQFNEEDYIKLHHQLIWFGRTICTARNPNCKECRLTEFCMFFKENQ